REGMMRKNRHTIPYFTVRHMFADAIHFSPSFVTRRSGLKGILEPRPSFP
ncbi:MAG: hypothetical protein JWM68_5590, partial [Verrucomicrobiales bacterium]|nr:hypothetical protein [Verrucomicrobiales bacterium]